MNNLSLFYLIIFFMENKNKEMADIKLISRVTKLCSPIVYLV